jgi:hypothetical protein
MLWEPTTRDRVCGRADGKKGKTVLAGLMNVTQNSFLYSQHIMLKMLKGLNTQTQASQSTYCKSKAFSKSKATEWLQSDMKSRVISTD